MEPAGRTRGGSQPRRLFQVRRDFEQLAAWPHDHFYLLFPDPKPHFGFWYFVKVLFPALTKYQKPEPTIRDRGKAGRGTAKARHPKQRTSQTSRLLSPPHRQPPAQPWGLRPFS